MRSFILLICLFPISALAQENYPPTMEGARAEVYKTTDQAELKLWIFEPEDHKPNDRRPAIIFFFGGGWKKGTPAQFEQHCRYLASRGMVAITADYRVAERHKTLADQCVRDAKSAVRFLRSHASRLGIDPQRIVAGGGSAGGHLAACTGVILELDEPDEDASVPSVPNALALFNPALVLAPYDDLVFTEEKIADLTKRTGVDPKKISPIEWVRQGLPPTIIFHGDADTAVPFVTVEKYTAAANKSGNRCELVAYPGASHGFFNYGRGGTPGESFLDTVSKLDQFLASLGYLEGEPTVHLPKSSNAHLRGSFTHTRDVFLKTGKGSVAFLGGSITEMNGYRPKVCEFLQATFPQTEFTFTNAGIASTCSTTGAFRLAEDVLASNPDLFFVEFAVNDDQDAAHAEQQCVRGMEGILRQALKHNPKMDIVVTHFVNPSMLETIKSGGTPVSSGRHEAVAAHYGVSTSDLAREVAQRITRGELTWKQYGGTHPKEPGNRLAADMVIELLQTGWKNQLPASSADSPRRLPKQIDKGSYVRGRMLGFDMVQEDDRWVTHIPDWSSIKGNCRERFRESKLLCASEPGASLSLPFSGAAVGAYVLAGPDAGRVEYSIDGSEFQRLDLYHRFSRGLHYPRTVMFAADLDRGPHELKIRVSKEKHANSLGHAVRILKFVTN